MSSIGPELPPHLLNQSNAADSDDEQGPSLPPNVTPVNPSKPVVEEEDDEDDYAPALPPDLVASRSAGPSKKILGPAPPPSRQQYYDDDDSDDDVGPRPLPSGANHQEIDAVKQFRETEEKRRKMIEVRLPCCSESLHLADCMFRKPRSPKHYNEMNGCLYHHLHLTC